MKRIFTFGIAVTTGLILLQSAEAGSHGGSHSFSSAPHFAGPSFSSAHHFAGPGRSFSASQRFSSARFSSGARYYNRNYISGGPRFSTTTALRNKAYFANRASFAADRTTAFNARTSSSATLRPAANRSRVNRTQGVHNQDRIVARHGANWQRNWDRSRDHWWHGRRCHFHNNFWVIYEPFFGYPFGYGYYPYGGYYDNGYYDSSYYDNGAYADSYASNQYSQPTEEEQPQSDTGSRVDEVQRALAHQGYYDGPVDGRLSNATRKALRKYQRDRGLEVTGSIDQAVIESLRLR
jgi:hypothetical protein